MGQEISQDISEEIGVVLPGYFQDTRGWLQFFRATWEPIQANLPLNFVLEKSNGLWYRVLMKNDARDAAVVLISKTWKVSKDMIETRARNYHYEMRTLVGDERIYELVSTGSVLATINGEPVTVRLPLDRGNASVADVELTQGMLRSILNPYKHEADIVMIHGISGDPDRTFAIERGDQYWPCLLAREGPQSIYSVNENCLQPIRVLSVKHALSLDHCPPVDTILEDLYNAFILAQVGRKPVVFIVHSMGGLVIKRLLRRSEQDEEYPYLWLNTRGVVFLGTPHLGAANAALPQIVGAKSPAVQYLRPSKQLTELNNWYLSARNHEYVNVVEGRPLVGKTSIVSREEGTLPHTNDAGLIRRNI